MANEQPTPSFLSESERTECGRVAQSDSALHSQRAKALLMVDSGLTHREAGMKSGLSIGQVRYILNRYRKIGLAVFPPPPVDDKQGVKQEQKPKKLKSAGGKSKKAKKKKKKSKKEKRKKEQKDGSGSKKKKAKKKKDKKKKK